MKNKVIYKFLGSYVLLILIAMLILDFFVSIKLRDYYESNIAEKLKSNAYLTAKILQETDIITNNNLIYELIEGIARDEGVRITVIDKQGNVLSDSEEASSMMENHMDRPEMQDAMTKDYGETVRFSDTLGLNMKYVALPIKINGTIEGVVRFSLPLVEIESQLRIIYRVVLIGGLIAVIIAIIIGYFISKSITRPITEMTDIAEHISKGDFSKKVSAKSKDELGVLAKSLNRMADQLQSKIEALDKLNITRKDFIANVSHELKTPLTSIKGFIETLEDGALSDKENSKKFILIIKKHTERIDKIIDDLLSLSELESERDGIEKEEFNLKVSLDEILQGFTHLIVSKKHVLTVDARGNDFRINSDKCRIEQVLVNLINNAIKYTKDGGNIKVSIFKDKKYMIVEIEDSGIGIPAEHLDRIFERFYRVDKARSRQLGGTGLGLSIVKHIVLLHDGKIDVESKVSKGTKIRVSLPWA
ncbi:MAG: ATP-binding protein [Candidatus Kaelpia aquatica]|nr:ATP-binding protein [Candidatus Kaelpia aquatica]